ENLTGQKPWWPADRMADQAKGLTETVTFRLVTRRGEQSMEIARVRGELLPKRGHPHHDGHGDPADEPPTPWASRSGLTMASIGGSGDDHRDRRDDDDRHRRKEIRHTGMRRGTGNSGENGKTPPAPRHGPPPEKTGGEDQHQTHERLTRTDQLHRVDGANHQHEHEPGHTRGPASHEPFGGHYSQHQRSDSDRSDRRQLPPERP